MISCLTVLFINKLIDNFGYHWPKMKYNVDQSVDHFVHVLCKSHKMVSLDTWKYYGSRSVFRNLSNIILITLFTHMLSRENPSYLLGNFCLFIFFKSSKIIMKYNSNNNI